MTDYTPSTEDVERCYVYADANSELNPGLAERKARAEFDRWYAAESARLRAEGAAEALEAFADANRMPWTMFYPGITVGDLLRQTAARYRQSVTPVPEEERDNDAFPNDCLY